MPTLRDRIRDALSRRELSDREARGDLDAILAQARRKKSATWSLALVPAFATVAVIAYLVVFRNQQGPPPAPLVADRSESPSAVHLYLHVTGEPEDRAVSLDLDTKGDP